MFLADTENLMALGQRLKERGFVAYRKADEEGAAVVCVERERKEGYGTHY